jgi:cytochrome c oxidase subunit 3
MTETHSGATLESAWSGGGSPFAIGSKKLGMWLFIVSDVMTFSAVLIAYSYSRLANPNWPRAVFPIWPAVAFSTTMTVVLLASSLTMVMAVAAAQRNDRAATVRWMLGTMLGGLIFCGLHIGEWFHLIDEGVRPFSNPWGSPLFGAAFFGITGLHMTHVMCGVFYLGIVAVGFGREKFSSEDVEVSGLYWHFVDLVWMFVFPMVYLMSVKYA